MDADIQCPVCGSTGHIWTAFGSTMVCEPCLACDTPMRRERKRKKLDELQANAHKRWEAMQHD